MTKKNKIQPCFQKGVKWKQYNLTGNDLVILLKESRYCLDMCPDEKPLDMSMFFNDNKFWISLKTYTKKSDNKAVSKHLHKGHNCAIGGRVIREIIS